MKKSSGRLISLLLVISLVLMLSPQMVAAYLPPAAYIYTLTDGKATITKYNGTGGNITIPATLGGYPVVAIGTQAFNACATLTGVTIPGNVQMIGNGAFMSCINLVSVILQAGVKIIDNNVFVGCTSLKNASLPAGLTKIGATAFSGCRSLTSLVIPYGVTTLEQMTFYQCQSLQSVSIPSSVTTLQFGVFYECTSLTRLVFPASIATFTDGAISGCSNLAAAYFFGPKPTITKSVFGGSASTFKVYYHVTAAGWNSYTYYYYPSQPFCVLTLNLMSGPRVANKVSYAPINGGKIAIPAAPLRSGYTFAGWYSNAACTIPFNFAATNVHGDLTLYTKWNALPPTVPGSPKAQSVSYNSIHVSWSASLYASGYYIWRSDTAAGTFTKLATVASASVASYTDAGLATGKSWYYKVQAYRTVGTGTLTSQPSAAVTAKAIPATPAGFTVKSAAYNSLSLAWTAVAGASGYEVRRAASASGTYALINTLSGTSYTNGGLQTGSRYYYKIRAFRIVGTGRVYGNYTTAVSGVPVPGAPTGFTVKSGSYNSLKLAWTAVAGASGYNIYRATALAGTYEILKSVTANYSTDNGLTAGKTYYYKIESFRMVGSNPVIGPLSAAVGAKPVPAVPTGVLAVRTASTSIKLSWNSVAGATGYQLFRAEAAAGPWTLAAEPAVPAISFTNTKLTTGKTYYYKIRAYRLVDSTRVYGSFSIIVSAMP